MKRPGSLHRSAMFVVALALVAACAPTPPASVPAAPRFAREPEIMRGRELVIQHGCGGCHGGGANPAAQGQGPLPALNQWLAGTPHDTLPVGEFRAWPRNLTPDDETGTGRYSERQIFNALRYGLRPSATPDVEITSPVPGQGNHPAVPNYLSPAMPWAKFRYMPENDLRAIAAYIKNAVRPVSHRVQDSEAPPDRWASVVAAEIRDSHVLPPFPTPQEELRTENRLDQVLRGRQLVVQHVCGDCHGGGIPSRAGWLAGVRGEAPTPMAPFVIEFPLMPGVVTRPRNLTPDNTTGLGRFTERQIFNALRYGLRPGETPDVNITSTTPGEGNFPANPKYLAPPMPWPEWRHMADADLWAIAAYLKHGLRPVSNRVQDSDGPPDFWASLYTVENIGPYPAPPFPTANERIPQ